MLKVVATQFYLQHADHYLRRLKELSDKNNISSSYKNDDTQSSQKNTEDKELAQASN